MAQIADFKCDVAVMTGPLARKYSIMIGLTAQYRKSYRAAIIWVQADKMRLRRRCGATAAIEPKENIDRRRLICNFGRHECISSNE